MKYAHNPRHRWYNLKEAFSPQLVESAIDDAVTSKNDLVVDPFCGSGTTTLTAANLGLCVSGIEVNPFLHFVSQVKLENSNVRILEEEFEAAFLGAERGKSSIFETFSTFSERAKGAKNREKWLFNASILRALSGAQSAVGDKSTNEKRLLHLCLLGAAIDVSNAYKDGKCLRYKKRWREYNYSKADFLAAINQRKEKIIEDLSDSTIKNDYCLIKLADSRETKFDRKFRLCVTSPPYLNSFDYTDIYRPELFLGGFIKSMNELRNLRNRTVRSHVQSSWKDPFDNELGSAYRKSYTKIMNAEGKLWDKRIPKMIQAYFGDMKIVLENLFSMGASDSKAWIIVSTSSYKGVEIPVDVIISEIGEMCGWKTKDIQLLRNLKRVSGQQWERLSENNGNKKPHLKEYAIILEKYD